MSKCWIVTISHEQHLTWKMSVTDMENVSHWHGKCQSLKRCTNKCYWTISYLDASENVSWCDKRFYFKTESKYQQLSCRIVLISYIDLFSGIFTTKTTVFTSLYSPHGKTPNLNEPSSVEVTWHKASFWLAIPGTGDLSQPWTSLALTLAEKRTKLTPRIGSPSLVTEPWKKHTCM